MSEFITAISTCRRSFHASEDAGLGHLEESLKGTATQLLRAALEKAAQEKSDSLPPLCPKCGTKLIELRTTERTVKTAFGEIKLNRITGRCRKCKKRVCPADEALGLDKGYSPAVQETAALLTSKMPVAEASAVLERLTGQQLSPTTMHRIAKEAGKKAQVKRKKRDEESRQGVDVEGALQPETLVIMIDAWNIRERDYWGESEEMRRRGEEPNRWHWVWTGTVFTLDSRGQKLDRAVIVDRGYVATREGAAGLSEQLHAEALRRGLGRAKRVLVLGDGASWIWNMAKDRFSGAVQRIDIYHVLQHVSAIAKEIHGDTLAAKQWQKRIKKRLLAGQIEDVIQIVQKSSESLEQAIKDAVEKELNYLEEHRGRMDYNLAKQLKEPIGSGAIESTCRQYQCRFKRSGQFWSTAGDEALMCLDTFWRNGCWRVLFPHINGLDPSRN